MKKLLLILLLIASTQIQASSFNSYFNTRFGFSAKYPNNLFSNKWKSDNGDGITLTNKSKGLKVIFYGALAVINNNIRDEYRSSIGYIKENKNKEITYKVLRKKWFVLSGYDYSKRVIFYTKTFFAKERDIFITYSIEYPIKDKKMYNNLIKVINKNFKP